MRVLIALLAALFFVAGCGGGGGSTQGDGDGGTVPDINLSKAIQQGEIPGYDETDPIKDQYLAVINYIRSLSIVCNDSSKAQGPSDPLQWDNNLFMAAKEHSEDMLMTGHYSHDGSGTQYDLTASDLGLSRGSHFDERIVHNGFQGNIKAENIAMMKLQNIQPSGKEWLSAMEGWIKSTHGHCSNIMSKQIKYFGMYEAKSQTPDANGTIYIYWTQDFGG